MNLSSGMQYIPYFRLCALELQLDEKSNSVNLLPYVIGGNTINVRPIHARNIAHFFQHKLVFERLCALRQSLLAKELSDTEKGGSRRSVCVCSPRLALKSAPITRSEHILDLALTKFQNKWTYYFPAIPHFHVRAALKSCHCELEADEVQSFV